MKKVYEYGLKFGHNSLALPEGAKVLTAQEQGGGIKMWILVHPEVTRMVERVFRVYGTGEEMPMNPGTYIATVQLGWTVWHVFEDTAAQ